MVELRDYQLAIAESAEKSCAGGGRPLIQLETGAGKTEIALELIRRYQDRDSAAQVLFVVPTLHSGRPNRRADGTGGFYGQHPLAGAGKSTAGDNRCLRPDIHPAGGVGLGRPHRVASAGRGASLHGGMENRR